MQKNYLFLTLSSQNWQFYPQFQRNLVVFDEPHLSFYQKHQMNI